MVKEERDFEIDILQLGKALLEKLVYIVIVTVIMGLLGFLGSTFLMKPVYQASAKMIVNTRIDNQQNVTNDQLNSAKNLVDTYAIIIRSQPVLEPVIENLGLQLDVEKLAKKVTVTSVNDTQVMQIAVQSKDAEQALQIVQQIEAICPAIIIDAVEAGSVKTIEPAHLKKEPVAPSTNLFTVVAAFLCIVTVVIIVMLRFLLDNSYKSETDLRNDLGLPVLGVIPDYDYCLKKKNEGKEGKYYGKV